MGGGGTRAGNNRVPSGGCWPAVWLQGINPFAGARTTVSFKSVWGCVCGGAAWRWAFQADRGLCKQLQAAVGSEIQESLSKLKGQRHEEANANFLSTYWRRSQAAVAEAGFLSDQGSSVFAVLISGAFRNLLPP